MDKEPKDSDEQKKIIKVIAIILAISISTYFIMIWISPSTNYLGKFLVGFGVSFAGIVLFSFCIKYIRNIYKQMKEKK